MRTEEEKEIRKNHREWQAYGVLWEESTKNSAVCQECAWMDRTPEGECLCRNPESPYYTETVGRFGTCEECER